MCSLPAHPDSFNKQKHAFPACPVSILATGDWQLFFAFCEDQADGGKVEYVEDWYLFKVKGGEEASEIEIKVLSLIEKKRGPAF